VAVMATVFNTYWIDTAAGGWPRAQLILSPGAEDALLNLIDSAKFRILIETEEFGSVPAIESALAVRVWAGENVIVILPAADRDRWLG